MRRKGWICAFAVLCAGASWFWFSRPVSRLLERPAYLVYVPSGIQRDARHPLVIALSPSGSASQMIAAWRPISEKFKWIILASKEFRNGIADDAILRRIKSAVQEGEPGLPIDRAKIIASGISGGAMGSHHFMLYYPDFLCGVIVNTGMMDREYSYPHKADYPKRRLAAFLASPTDFRYNEMKQDRGFLESLGWKTIWIEFAGGHTMAPVAVYAEAARWFERQLEVQDRAGGQA